MTDSFRRSAPQMGTIVTIEIAAGHGQISPGDANLAIDRAFGWFHEVERVCSRFDANSELRRLTSVPGQPVPAGEVLLSLVEFAIEVAEESGGAFDPTVGVEMERRGFNRHYVTGESIGDGRSGSERVSFRDVVVDRQAGTIMLRRPLVLDLGGVAKGFAIDMAAQELKALENFAIDAGGDLYLGGRAPHGAPWSIGIRHPRRDREVIATIQATNTAVCTSGDYERSTDAGGHHIIDPRQGLTAAGLASATVLAPTAMMADALATAAFVLGPHDGIELLTRLGAEGLLISADEKRFATKGLHGAILPHA